MPTRPDGLQYGQVYRKLLIEVSLVVEVLTEVFTDVLAIILMNGDPRQCRDLELIQVLGRMQQTSHLVLDQSRWD